MIAPAVEYRGAALPMVEVAAGAATSSPDALGTISGYGLRWNTWASINSEREGRFLERFTAGSFNESIRGGGVKLLFQHGRDPAIGERPLGPLSLRDDGVGLAFSAPLLDTSFARDLAPGLRGGLFGASVRFSVVKDVVVPRPERSADNPRGLPERTIGAADLHELSLVTFPAYGSSSATLRSTCPPAAHRPRAQVWYLERSA